MDPNRPRAPGEDRARKGLVALGGSTGIHGKLSFVSCLLLEGNRWAVRGVSRGPSQWRGAEGKRCRGDGDNTPAGSDALHRGCSVPAFADLATLNSSSSSISNEALRHPPVWPSANCNFSGAVAYCSTAVVMRQIALACRQEASIEA